MFLGAELQEMLDVALAVMRGERERPPLRVAYWIYRQYSALVTVVTLFRG